ncbi:MAG: zinc-ribbon domain-containing protein [Methanoregulaceae archaeon]|nr:zinc-ribbon domain-containing protein [Methanoregulaceae archaeon]
MFARHDEGGKNDSLLREGEHLLCYAPDVAVKTFAFNASLTNTRIFFVEKGTQRSGVPAKEIPSDSIQEGILEVSDGIPVLVITVKTSDDVRTMKLRFLGKGGDRVEEVEEWVRLLASREEAVVKKPVPLLEREEPVTKRPVSPFERDEPVAKKPVPLPEREEPPAPSVHSAPPALTIPKIPTGTASPAEREGSGVAFCHQCGKKIPEIANFCPFCGIRLHSASEMKEPGRGEERGTQIFRKLLRR